MGIRRLALVVAAAVGGSVLVAAPAHAVLVAPGPAAPPLAVHVALAPASDGRLAAAIRASRSAAPYRFTTVSYAQWYATRQLARRATWGARQMSCLRPMWQRESSWRYRAVSSGGTYLGIPQTTVDEIRSAGYTVTLFRANPEVQVLTGLRYISARYGSPCKAWSFWRAHGWY
jgi:hypothetical protein